MVHTSDSRNTDFSRDVLVPTDSPKECILRFYRWHWLLGVQGETLACWGSWSLQGTRALGRAAEKPGGRKADLLRVWAAQTLLEDWVLDLEPSNRNTRVKLLPQQLPCFNTPYMRVSLQSEGSEVSYLL